MWFLQEVTREAGSAGSGLAALGHFRALGVGAVPRCLLSGPGVTRAEGTVKGR